MKRSSLLFTGSGVAGLLLCALLIYQLPAIKSRVDWRIEIAVTYLRGIADPAGKMPTPVEVEAVLPPPKVSINKLPTPHPGCHPLTLHGG